MNGYRGYRGAGMRNGAGDSDTLLTYLSGTLESWFASRPSVPPPPPPPADFMANLPPWFPDQVPEQLTQMVVLALGFFLLVLAIALAYYSVVCGVRLAHWTFRMAWRLAVVLVVIAAVFLVVGIVAPWALAPLGLTASGTELWGATGGGAQGGSAAEKIQLVVNERGERVLVTDWGRRINRESAQQRRQTGERFLGELFGETVGHSIVTGEAVNWTWVGIRYGATALGNGVSSLGATALRRMSGVMGGVLSRVLPRSGRERGKDEL